MGGGSALPRKALILLLILLLVLPPGCTSFTSGGTGSWPTLIGGGCARRGGENFSQAPVGGRLVFPLGSLTGGGGGNKRGVNDDGEGEEGDKRGFTILRVLSQGAQGKGSRQKNLPPGGSGAGGKYRKIRLDEAIAELDPRG
jgi:hypothetical protein